MRQIPFALALVALLISSAALAAVAPQVVLQHAGRLLDASDNPISTSVELTLSLHPSATDAETVFTDAWTLTPERGIYGIAIGDTADGHKVLERSKFNGTPLWLGIKVGGVEILPRQAIGSTARAVRADVAADVDCVGCIDAGELSFDPTPADGSVSTQKLANGAVTAAKLGPGAVTAEALAAGAVTADALASEAVTTGHLVNASVTAAKLHADAVGTTALVDLAVTNAKLALNAIATGNLANAAVTAEKLANNAVTAAAIADGAVANRAIADGTISRAKFAPGAVQTGNTRAHYTFDENAGTTVADQSSNGNTLTLPGSGIAWSPDGQRGPGVQCLGATGNVYLQAASNPTLRFEEALTAEAWVFPLATKPAGTIVGKGNTFLLGVNNNQLQAAIREAGSTGWSWYGNGYVANDVWSYVAITYDGFAIRTYVNQILTSVTPFAKGPLFFDSNPLVVCGRSEWPNEQFNGRVDNVRLSAEVKTFQQPTFVGAYASLGAASGEITTLNTWLDVPNAGRLDYVKRSNTSVLRIEYDDTIRTAGSVATGHMYVEVTDTGSTALPQRCYASVYQSTPATTNNIHHPVHMLCIVTGMASGPHSFGIRAYVTAGNGYFGWEHSQRNLTVEEIFIQ